MPHIPKETIRSIVTLLANGHAIGTAFVLMAREVDGDFFDFYYLITCDHCVKKPVRARFDDGSYLDIQPGDWQKPSTGDDVAAYDITGLVNFTMDINGSINAGLTVSRDNPHFGIGTDLYMLGLLVNEPDLGRNVPRARFGNLSAFADDSILSKQGNGAMRPCHLADMRSRTGFSGSPVIGYVETTGLDSHVKQKILLIGIHSDQYPETIRILSPGDRDAVEIASSMTLIVPAWIILELIEHDVSFNAQRVARKKNGGGLIGNTHPVS